MNENMFIVNQLGIKGYGNMNPFDNNDKNEDLSVLFFEKFVKYVNI